MNEIYNFEEEEYYNYTYGYCYNIIKKLIKNEVECNICFLQKNIHIKCEKCNQLVCNDCIESIIKVYSSSNI